MSFSEALQPSLPTIAAILAAMAVVALVETVIPLRGRTRWNREHLGPNLTLTFVTFATNAFLNAVLLVAVAWLYGRGFGLLPLLALPPIPAAALAVVALDFSFYVAHVAMHKVPALWRYHRVHHSDPVVDVTTTIRQHPGESAIRYAFMGTFAIAIGPSPVAFGVYRAVSALTGLVEHADIRAPLRLDRMLSLVTTWPHMHKVHHSRLATETDTNYGNVFSWFDRAFGTFTPSYRGVGVAYGLAGDDDPAMQTTMALLAMPFRDADRQPSPAVTPWTSGASRTP